MSEHTEPIRKHTVLHCLVSGRVQGVGFRYSAVHAVAALELSGWIRNKMDGRVETLVSGPEEDIQFYQSWLSRGTPVSRVEDVEVRYRGPAIPGDSNYAGFEKNVGFSVRG